MTRAVLGVGSTLKHYELLRVLGQGAMGTVFLARDTKLGRLVAVKTLFDPSRVAAARFLAEARATARCKHENIVVVYEVDENDDCPYMVLEYLEGQTLREWLATRERSRGPGPAIGAASARVPPGQVVELMLPVVRALVCAHEQGIVHRDLKPANVFLTDAGSVKVLDFGIAKRLEADELSIAASALGTADVGGELTEQGALMGTLLYMAPEQCRGEEVDARADLWAMGVLLFRLVAGRYPLEAASSVEHLALVGTPDEPMPSARSVCPDAGTLCDVIDRCLKKPKDERFASADELLAALEALLPRRGALSFSGDEAPFAGLSAFQQSDAARFFGREREVAEALGRLRSQPLLAVAGPSGVGKSSFVRAGVLPTMRRSLERVETALVRPGRHPLAALADVLTQATESWGEGSTSGGPTPGSQGEPSDPVERLRAQPGYFGARLRALCRRRGGARRFVLFVDQFEELYTLGAEPAERAAFLACLAGAADDASSPLRVVLSVRSDFLDRIAEDRHFSAEVTQGLVLLPPLGREGLRDALLRPLEASGYRFESDAVVDAVLEAVGRAPSPLPLLQFTASKLWEARDQERKLLTRAGYEALGGVAGALSAHADAVLTSMIPAERALAREVLVRLVTPERTRAVVNVSELRALAEDGGAVERVVERLADARLLLVERAGEHEGASVELVHESLIEHWSALKQWLDEGEHNEHFMPRLRAAAQQWAAGGEAEGLLWRERAADEARAWLERHRASTGAGPTGLSEREERYLHAVVALADRARRRRRRIAATFVTSLIAIALVVSLLALRAQREAAHARDEARRADRQATHARHEARRADDEAISARNIARLSTARDLLASEPTTALILLRELEPPNLPTQWSSLVAQSLLGGVSGEVLVHPAGVRRAVYSPDGARIATACDDKIVRLYPAGGSGEPLALRGHEGTIHSVAFSPDGALVASASLDKTARIWKADGTGEPIVLRGHEAQVFSAAFSPDGRRIATTSLDKTVRVWNADGTGQPLVLHGHEAAVFTAAFSPDGARLLTSSFDKTARVWNADGTGQPVVLRGHDAPVHSAAFSPDGTRIATASGDKTVRIWATPKPAARLARPLLALRGHDQSIFSVAFSPDGTRLVTASFDKTARIYRTDGRGEPLVLRGHEGMLYAASFSPDGHHVLTASLDKTARIWGADGPPGAPTTLRGHEGLVQNAEFDHGGTRVATASEDKTVRLWRVDAPGAPKTLRGHSDLVRVAIFSPDGKHVVSTSEDHTARIWRADGVGKPVVLPHDDGVMAALFSPDGSRLLTTSKDHTARVWNADGTGEPIVLRGHEHWIYSADFSADGRRLTTASADKTARVWSADGTGEPLVLRGHEGPVYTADLSPDGTRVVTASGDKTARIWRVDGAGEPIILRGHEAQVFSAAFSPDGARIVTASFDRTVRVWNANGQGEPLVLRGHEDWVKLAAFSPDGKRIVTASEDRTARVWNADGSGQHLVLRGHRGAVNAASFNRDGTRVVTSSDDKTARLWTELTPLLGVDDPKLWLATSYCLSVERRVELLNMTDAAAQADQQACERRVREARAAATGAPNAAQK